MDMLHEGKTFEKADYSESKIEKQQFIKCNFKNCNFSKSDLTNIEFDNCCFIECNLTMAILENATLDNIHFIKCKLVGLNFGSANSFLFSVEFTNCHLDYSYFIYLKMKKTKFSECSLKEVEFNGSDLTMSVFENCDLSNSIFTNSKLDKADFRTSINYSFDLDLNSVKRAKFSNLQLAGLLSKYNLDIDFS